MTEHEDEIDVEITLKDLIAAGRLLADDGDAEIDDAGTLLGWLVRHCQDSHAVWLAAWEIGRAREEGRRERPPVVPKHYASEIATDQREPKIPYTWGYDNNG
jgi:hypothetical protein